MKVTVSYNRSVDEYQQMAIVHKVHSSVHKMCDMIKHNELFVGPTQI